MIDFHAAQVWGHRRSIERYCRLLATDLTDLERQYNAQTDCGGACAIRAIGKERCQAAISYAGGVRILHGPSSAWSSNNKSESRCRGDGRSIASVMVGRHTGNPQMRSKRQTAWDPRPLSARRLQRKQTIPKSANIMHACGMRGSRWRTDASFTVFPM